VTRKREREAQGFLFGDAVPSDALDAGHYLGARGARPVLTYEDVHGVILFARPSSRRLPTTWLELSRWCIKPGGSGSAQWRACLAWLRRAPPGATTIVSYADPSVGHTGALYRACNWIWAPTWHVLREPPTGQGLRGGKLNRAKHRYVYLLRPDPARERLLAVQDEALVRRFPWVGFREPVWRRGVPQVSDRDRFKRWAAQLGGSSGSSSSGNSGLERISPND
jgi:hypothetical protein